MVAHSETRLTIRDYILYHLDNILLLLNEHCLILYQCCLDFDTLPIKLRSCRSNYVAARVELATMY